LPERAGFVVCDSGDAPHEKNADDRPCRNPRPAHEALADVRMAWSYVIDNEDSMRSGWHESEVFIEQLAARRWQIVRTAGSDATMFIQWKGTDVCLDFHCPCQPEDTAYSSHLDGFFAYFVRCPRCGAVYEMGTQVIARRLADGEEPRGKPLDLEYDDESWADRSRSPDTAESGPVGPAVVEES
jgi:hypothetical protein